MITAEQKKIYELLNDQCPFQDVTDEEWPLLFSIFKINRFKAGEIIIQEGDKGDDAYILIEGVCCLFKMGMAIKHYEAGHYFGEFALLDKKERTGTIRAETDGAGLLVFFHRII